MRTLLIVAGIVGLMLIVGTFFVWRTVRQWTRKGPSKEELVHPSTPADVRLCVTVEQSSERLGHDRQDYEFSEAKVIVRNAKGKDVESPNIHVGMNGVPMKFSVPTGNYYDRYPQYRLRDDPRVPLSAGTDCNFTLNWDDAPALPAASLRLPKKMRVSNFQVPETHPANRDLEISWSDVEAAGELVLYRTVTFTDDFGSHGFRSGGPNAEDAIRKKIGGAFFHSAAGKLIVPASYFSVPGGEKVSSIHLEITARTTGKFTLNFLPDGSIEAVRKITLHVDIVEPVPTAR